MSFASLFEFKTYNNSNKNLPTSAPSEEGENPFPELDETSSPTQTSEMDSDKTRTPDVDKCTSWIYTPFGDLKIDFDMNKKLGAVDAEW